MALQQACADCQIQCDMCFAHCKGLLAEGKKEHEKTTQLCVDCAECCKLAATLTASAALLKWAADSTAIDVFREGLIICGWVAMWRPIQIFLYDWWPILGERRLYDRLCRMPVQIICAAAP